MESAKVILEKYGEEDERVDVRWALEVRKRYPGRFFFAGRIGGKGRS